MADLVRLAYYPFLPEVREAVRASGVGMDTVLAGPLYDGVRRRATERIEGALGDGFPEARLVDERSALLELLSVAVARMLAVRLGDRTLLARYAAAEARRVEVALLRDQDPAMLAEALTALGIPADRAAGDEPGRTSPSQAWVMPLAAYLLAAPSESAYKLVLQRVVRGSVFLTTVQVARLVRESLQRRITQELEAEARRVMPEEVAASLAPLVLSLEPRLEEARANWSSGDFGPVQPGLFPPCIKEILGSLQRAENVPHHGRFAFATFLHTVGWNSEQILDYLSSTPNFDREKSRYQIEHVTGEKSVGAYTPPGCATMQTNGICPLDKRDGLCFRIKHPLSYYRAKLRFNDAQGNAASAAAAQAPGPSAASPTAPPPTASPTSIQPDASATSPDPPAPDRVLQGAARGSP